MKNWIKYFAMGALLALPLIASATPPHNCESNNYPSCCPTCKNKDSNGTCYEACKACSGVDMINCDSECDNACP